MAFTNSSSILAEFFLWWLVVSTQQAPAYPQILHELVAL
jgi:hypothetical protein